MKSSGETLLEAWMPLHPVPQASMPNKAVARMRFQFHFTARTIGMVKVLAIQNSVWSRCMLVATTRIAIGCAWIAALPCLADSAAFAARNEKAFKEAGQIATQDPTNTSAQVQLARAAFEWAEFANSSDHRAEIAERGIAAARSALRQAETNAAAHYWLALNLGQLARTKSIGALRLVKEMETELLRARTLDPHVDFAGADRALGLLYRDAPGWPTSVGSRKKAREHLENAAKLHPEFPDNPLALAETFADWNDQKNLQPRLKAAEESLTSSSNKFTGVQWEQSRADWTKRLATLKAKAAKTR
jgi:hypothetical protein